MKSHAITLGFIAAMMAAVFAVSAALSAEAQAQALGPDSAPQLQIGCKPVKVANIDPMFDPEHPHRHQFFGNKSIKATSTNKSLRNNKATTCNFKADTSAYWAPIVRDGSGYIKQTLVTAYYIGLGDQTQVRQIPAGLNLFANKTSWRCGGASSKAVATPPYGCKERFLRFRVQFPDCWDPPSRRPESLVYSKNGVCPSTHWYRIPAIRLAFRLDNTDGLQSPLRVSAGGGEWKDSSFLHANIMEATQLKPFRSKIRQCVINAPDGNTVKGCGGASGGF